MTIFQWAQSANGLLPDTDHRAVMARKIIELADSGLDLVVHGFSRHSSPHLLDTAHLLEKLLPDCVLV